MLGANATAGAATTIEGRITHNGSEVAGSQMSIAIQNTNQRQPLHVTIIVSCSSSDTLVVQMATPNSSGSQIAPGVGIATTKTSANITITRIA